jgi:hypothetical protein
MVAQAPETVGVGPVVDGEDAHPPVSLIDAVHDPVVPRWALYRASSSNLSGRPTRCGLAARAP